MKNSFIENSSRNVKKSFNILMVFLVSFSFSLYGIKDESNQDRWEKPVGKGLESEVPGFLVNLGPTGLRAVLKAKSFVVKYIFKGSPAGGKLKLNDEIVGVNGKEFGTHFFGGEKNRGIEGPIYDFGLAIEASEGSSGELQLMVKRAGSSVNVSVQLEKLGTFSSSFPENCDKAKLLHKRALDYLATKPGMGPDGQCAAILALISSDDKSHQQAGKDLVMKWNNVPGEGTWTWQLGFRSIALAEYYLLTQDSSVLNTLKGTLDLLRRAQYKGSNIQIWKAKDGESQEVLDRHQQLYDGGFGHSPFKNGFGNGGYGPMQPPTILAVIAWQLGRDCGIEAKHEGIEKALQFMNYGTNAGGNVAYGGEFTLNNGPINTERWRASNRRGNAQKSGLSIIAYNMTPEYKKSESYLKLHKENMHETFKGMANGHADGIMAMTWGMLGTGSSGDEKLKRKVFDYFKIWLNMTRCHGSKNYVALPGRDYADGAYYRDGNRAHVTAMAALMYSFANPKLQVHGVKVAIPGVNHKQLSPALAQAYRAILEGKYGQAAKVISQQGGSAGKNGERMTEYLNKKAGTQLKPLEALMKEGHWQEVQEFFAKQGVYWSGVPSFDSRQNFFKSLLTDKGGKNLFNADVMYHKGYYGQALKLSIQATAETALDEVKKASAKFSSRIKDQSADFIMELKQMEVKGEWYTLYMHLKSLPKKYGGIEEVDTLAGKLMPPFKEPSGKALALVHKSMLDKNFSKAYKSILQIEKQAKIERHKKIASKVKETISQAASEKVAELQRIKDSGMWSSLYTNLSASAKTYGGIEVFNKFYSATVPLIRSSAGRVLVSAEKLMKTKKYSLASKGLLQIRDNTKVNNEIKTIAKSILNQVDSEVQPMLAKINSLEGEGDWYTLQQEMRLLNRTLSGVELFDQNRKRLEAKFRENKIRDIINAGQEFTELKNSYLKRKTAGRKAKLEKFQKENSSNYYGKKAKELLGK